MASLAVRSSFLILCQVLTLVSTLNKITLYSTPGVELTKVTKNLYYFSNESLNWFAAEKFCRQNNLDLVSFETELEHELISDYVMKLNMTRAYETYWIGGIDLASPASFYWSLNGQPMNFNMWRSNMPSKANNHHCVGAQNINNQYFKWVNADCSRASTFVCEKSLTF